MWCNVAEEVRRLSVIVVSHVLRELSSSAQAKLHRHRALRRVPCQMTPITLPPMMPRSPGRGEKIHYTEQIVPP